MIKQLLTITICAWMLCCQAQTKTYYIADRTIDCSGDGPAECLLYKQNKKGKWLPLQHPVKGFAYKTGYEYKVKLKKDTGGSFVLQKIIQKKQTTYNPLERLENNYWVITGLYSDSNFIKVLDTTKIYIEFHTTKPQFSGRGLCKLFTGNCSVNQDSIQIKNVQSNADSCEGAPFVDLITGMLQVMKRYEVKGWQLTFFGPENTTMVFKRRYLTVDDLKQD